MLSVAVYAQNGCTDPLANNHNTTATINDGSCTYNYANVLPLNSTLIDTALNETSGLLLWNNDLWTHNDGGNPTDLYAIDLGDLNLFSTSGLSGVSNVDWEDIAQDDDFIYIGDFGNNASGNRTDLKIYKVSKSSIIAGNPLVDTINFSYEDQTDFSPQSGNTTNFDCEALIVTDTGIYLFTKEWTDQKTSLYFLPKSAGTYSAVLQGSYDLNGLVTGATYIKGKQVVVLSGYNLEIIDFMPLSIAPNTFLMLLYDFQGDNFFTGNKRKVDFAGEDHLQVEGITSSDAIHYYLSNERYNANNVDTPAQIHELDLSGYLSNYLSYNNLDFNSNKKISVFPNPSTVSQNVYLDIPNEYLGKNAVISIYDTYGREVFVKNKTNLSKQETLEVFLSSAGIYILKIKVENNLQNFRLIKM